MMAQDVVVLYPPTTPYLVNVFRFIAGLYQGKLNLLIL